MGLQATSVVRRDKLLIGPNFRCQLTHAFSEILELCFRNQKYVAVVIHVHLTLLFLGWLVLMQSLVRGTASEISVIRQKGEPSSLMAQAFSGTKTRNATHVLWSSIERTHVSLYL